MKKIILCLMLIVIILTGCGKKGENDVLEDFKNKVNNSNSYYLSGNMELVNNEDIYTYDISVSYKKDNYYKIELVNSINNHKQIILRNDDGVYVVTPSLNKSFKFQSDWPYNNSQVYLLSSLLEDISNDKDRKYESNDKNNIFTSSVNYPNNEKLIKQKVYFNKSNLPEIVEVIDDEGVTQIKMKFNKIDLKAEFNDTYFDLNSILNIEESNDNINEEPNKEKDVSKTQETATIDDIIYPMYLPANTYLTNQEKVNTDNGERLILTFTGDDSFVLVEETTKYSNKAEIISTYGDIELIGPSVAVINDNSANWFANGIEYYMVSDTMKTPELLKVAKSISVLPVSK